NFHINLRRILEARQAIRSEMRIRHPAILKMHCLKQRVPETLSNRAGNLVLQSLRIDNGATIERLHYTYNLRLTAGQRDFSARRHIAAFFKSACNAESALWARLLLAPAEFIGRGL